MCKTSLESLSVVLHYWLEQTGSSRTIRCRLQFCVLHIGIAGMEKLALRIAHGDATMSGAMAEKWNEGQIVIESLYRTNSLETIPRVPTFAAIALPTLMHSES